MTTFAKCTVPIDEVKQVQDELGLVVDGWLGPKTWESLTGDLIDHHAPPWLREARRFIGIKEIPGKEHHPLILRWLATTTVGNWAANRDETPWCSAFVNAMIESQGLMGTKSAAAKSWLDWGEPCGAQIGAIVIFDSSRNSWAGHVAFVDAVYEDGRLDVLGGNQNNQVSSVTRYVDQAIGFRWPTATTLFG